MSAPGIVELADGRSLAYQEAGDPAGFPIILAHGFPGSRLEAQVVGGSAAESRVRLVCLDRPGFGRSDPAPGRQVRDWPADVVALADHLGIETFAIVGFSAGGPYALACAALLGARVAACGVVSSPGPLDRPGSTDGMAIVNRLLFGAGRRLPGVASALVRVLARTARAEPATVARRMGPGMAVPDRDVLASPVGAQYGAAITEGFRQGPAGPILDAALLVRPWGFAVDRIVAPTIVWHGTEDRNVPARWAAALGSMVPRAEIRVIDGAGHLLFIERSGSILAAVREHATA